MRRQEWRRTDPTTIDFQSSAASDVRGQDREYRPADLQVLFSRNADTIERCERAMPERVAAARRLIEQGRWPSRDLGLYEAIEFVRPVL